MQAHRINTHSPSQGRCLSAGPGWRGKVRIIGRVSVITALCGLLLFVQLSSVAPISRAPADLHAADRSPLSVDVKGPPHSDPPGITAGPASLPTPIQHVFLIFMENEGVDQIYGTEPYETYLANTYAWGGDALTHHETGYYAVCHPSAPNYLAVTSGNSLQCGSDNYNNYTSENNLFNLLDTAGRSWTSYAESMPSPCDMANSGEYAIRHNPVPFYGDLGGNGASAICETHNLPIANLTQDFPYGTTPPAFTYIAPNLLNDGHDTSAAVADRFLSQFVSRLVNTSWFGSSVIFIAYDESYGASPDGGYAGLDGGPVYMVAASNYSKGIGPVDSVNDSHYNLLSTIEWLLGLPGTGTGNDSTAAFPAMKGLFSFGQPFSIRLGANQTSGEVPFAVQFEANLTGGAGPYGYSWSFGDGNTDGAANPSHVFEKVGTFNVTLNATDSALASASAYIIVRVLPNSHLPLLVTARANVSEGIVPLRAEFYTNVSGGAPPYVINWEFGDGGSGAGLQLLHQYNNSGSFSAEVTATDSVGLQASDHVAIDVYPLLSASIVLASTLLTLGSTARAVASWTGGIPGPGLYDWYVGGVEESHGTQDTFNFTPTSAGVYHLGLTVIDVQGNRVNTSAVLTVVPETTPSGSGAFAWSTGATEVAILGLVGAVAAIVGVWTVRRRRGDSGSP